jgi:hypothetical protein
MIFLNDIPQIIEDYEAVRKIYRKRAKKERLHRFIVRCRMFITRFPWIHI